MSNPTPTGSSPTTGAASLGTPRGSSSGSSSGTVPRLVLAWTVVGVPLAYGVYETAKKASALFTG